MTIFDRDQFYDLCKLHGELHRHTEDPDIHVPYDAIISAIDEKIDTALDSFEGSGTSGVDEDTIKKIIGSYGFLTDPDGNIYATRQWVNNLNFLKSTDLAAYATQKWVMDKIAGIEPGGDVNYGSVVSYALSVKSTDTGAYLIGTISIDGVDTSIYGIDTKGSTNGDVTVSNKNATLKWGEYVTVASINGLNIDVGLPNKPEGSGSGTGGGSGTGSTVYSYFAVIYKNSLTTPSIPSATSGSYDFETKTLSTPTGWTNTPTAKQDKETTWYCTCTFYSDGTGTPWIGPYIYRQPKDIISSMSSMSAYSVTVYHAEPYTSDFDSTALSQRTPNGGTFDYETKTLTTLPTNTYWNNWYKTPEEARNAVSGVSEVYWSTCIFQKDDDVETHTDWSTPSKWFDIGLILSEADKNAKEIKDDTIRESQSMIETARVALQGDITSLGKLVSDNSARIDSLNAGEVKAAVDSIIVLYKWVEYDGAAPSSDDIVKTLTSGNADTLNSGDTYKKSSYFNKYIKIGSKYYKYVPDSVEILSLVSSLRSEVNENKSSIETLNTAYEKILDDSWVAGVVEDTIESGSANIKASMVKLLKDSITLSVQSTYDKETGASFQLSLDEKTGSSALINALKIVLNGDTIAKSIAAQDMIIGAPSAAKTVITTDGQVRIAANSTPTIAADHETRFNTDGSGFIDGGNISWGRGCISSNYEAYGLCVKGAIVAKAGVIGNSYANWTIGQVDNCAALIGQDGDGRIVMTPHSIQSEQMNGSTIVGIRWSFLTDGSGTLANGNIYWDRFGNLRFKKDVANDIIDVKTLEKNNTISSIAHGAYIITHPGTYKATGGKVEIRFDSPAFETLSSSTNDAEKTVRIYTDAKNSNYEYTVFTNKSVTHNSDPVFGKFGYIGGVVYYPRNTVNSDEDGSVTVYCTGISTDDKKPTIEYKAGSSTERFEHNNKDIFVALNKSVPYKYLLALHAVDGEDFYTFLESGYNDIDWMMFLNGYIDITRMYDKYISIDCSNCTKCILNYPNIGYDIALHNKEARDGNGTITGVPYYNSYSYNGTLGVNHALSGLFKEGRFTGFIYTDTNV